MCHQGFGGNTQVCVDMGVAYKFGQEVWSELTICAHFHRLTKGYTPYNVKDANIIHNTTAVHALLGQWCLSLTTSQPVCVG